MGKRVSNKGRKARKKRPYARSETKVRHKPKKRFNSNPYQASI